MISAGLCASQWLELKSVRSSDSNKQCLRVINDWNELIYPYDFPDENKLASCSTTKNVTEDQFVPAQNLFRFVYAGATMALQPVIGRSPPAN